jgi:hypothetical protein
MGALSENKEFVFEQVNSKFIKRRQKPTVAKQWHARWEVSPVYTSATVTQRLEPLLRAHLDFGANASTVRMAESAPVESRRSISAARPLPHSATGRNRVLHALIVTLAMSRHQFVYTTHRQTAEALIAGIEAAWEFFGGVAKRVVLVWAECKVHPDHHVRFGLALSNSALDRLAHNAHQLVIEGESYRRKKGLRG